MPSARFFTAVLSLSISGGMMLGGPFFTGEGRAVAAARRTVKAAAGHTTRARRSADPGGGARRTSDASRGDVKVEESGETVLKANGARSAPAPAGLSEAQALKDAPSRERNAAPEKSSGAKAAEAKAAEAKAAEAKAAERGAAKSSAESVSNTKSPSEGAKPEGAPGRSADAHVPVAKMPVETPSSVKSAGEKGTGDPSSVQVTLEGPLFDGGDVPRAAAALDRMKAPFARCASIEGALTKNEASIDMRFLVRAPGRAEGVDIDKVRGVSADVVRCMMSVLARSYVGAPSDDPVGVAVTVRLRRPEAANN